MTEPLSKYEKETMILFNDDSPTATVYTCNRRLMNSLGSKGYKEIAATQSSKTFECPKRCISFRNATTKPRKVSEKQLAALEKARARQCGKQCLVNIA